MCDCVLLSLEHFEEGGGASLGVELGGIFGLVITMYIGGSLSDGVCVCVYVFRRWVDGQVLPLCIYWSHALCVFWEQNVLTFTIYLI